MTESMRALMIDGPGSARGETVEAPTPGHGQVVADVRRVGICGTDRELFAGTLPYFAQGKSRFPLRPGHEWCGMVSTIGTEVDPSWHGARVTADTMLGCGRCSRCRNGNGHVCADRDEIGIMGEWPGALAERILVPVSSLHRLPDSLDDRVGAPVEPGGNAWRAASAADPGPGKRVLVWGAGTIGLLTAAFAHASGAEVDILSLNQQRAKIAKMFGVEHYWTVDVPPPGSYDAVIDCTDDPTCLLPPSHSLSQSAASYISASRLHRASSTAAASFSPT
jgi:threonine dehydrogenase-like Zn-dependent dehydrogenase